MHMYVHTYIVLHIHTLIHIHTCIHNIHTYCTYIHSYIHIHIYIHTHTHTHAYTHHTQFVQNTWLEVLQSMWRIHYYSPCVVLSTDASSLEHTWRPALWWKRFQPHSWFLQDQLLVQHTSAVHPPNLHFRSRSCSTWRWSRTSRVGILKMRLRHYWTTKSKVTLKNLKNEMQKKKDRKTHLNSIAIVVFNIQELLLLKLEGQCVIRNSGKA